ncbi:MAG: hypothetical protein ACLROG_08685 [Coprococcus phoceensis]
MRYIMWYLLAINIVTFFLYGIDKQKARKKKVADTGGDASFNGGFGRLCWSLCRDANIPT